MSDHLRIRHRIAAYSKMKFKFFAHHDEIKAREPNTLQRLRKSANKNSLSPEKKKD